MARKARAAPPGRAVGALIPPLPRPQDLVIRNRLLDLLDRGVQRPLTVISAPAGTGKTITAATWAASGRAPGPVIWLEVGDTGIPVTHLWAELRTSLRRDGLWIRRAPADTNEPSGAMTCVQLNADVDRHAEPVTVVLDCNVALPAETAWELHQMLAAANGKLRLVLVGRADPMLPIQRYRLARTVLEIRTADLAFTVPEARELLLRRGVDLPLDVVEAVNERAVGWVAGLLLAAMSLAGSSDPMGSARALSGATGPVAEYLVAEVLNQQSPIVRDILLRTSLVDVLRPGLIEALVGTAGRRALAVISRGNAFIDEVPTMPGCYKYHPLFRELLAAQLTYEAPAENARLRAAAADWYAANGRYEDAVRTAAAAGAWDIAARYVIDGLGVLKFLEAGADAPVRRALEAMPDSARGAEVSLLRAAVSLARDDHPDCALHLARAQRALGAGDAVDAAASSVAMATLVMLLTTRGSSPDAALRAAVNAEQVLAGATADRVPDRPELAFVISDAKASAQLGLGRLDDASETLEQAMKDSSTTDDPPRRAAVTGRLALIAAWQGRMRRAVRLAHAASPGGAAGKRGVPAAEVALGWVYAETCDLPRSRRHIARAVDLGAEAGDDFVRVSLAVARSRVRRTAGEPVAARAALRLGEEMAGPPWLVEKLVVEQAKIAIQEGHAARAGDVLTSVSSPASPAVELVRGEVHLLAGRPATAAAPAAVPLRRAGSGLATRIDKGLLEAHRLARSGEEAAATAALDRALRLAAPEHIRRPFLDAPPTVRRLLRSQRGMLAARHAWLALDASPRTEAPAEVAPRPLRATSSEPEAVTSPVVVEALTVKETEVLGYLADLLTTEEIASEMYVSVNTIRTHVRNILRKLSASRRNEAIRRARQLGILAS